MRSKFSTRRRETHALGVRVGRYTFVCLPAIVVENWLIGQSENLTLFPCGYVVHLHLQPRTQQQLQILFTRLKSYTIYKETKRFRLVVSGLIFIRPQSYISCIRETRMTNLSVLYSGNSIAY